jgi:hypothetical protein
MFHPRSAGRAQDFLTLNQHLAGFLIQQRHLAGLDRLGRPPLREIVFVGATLVVALASRTNGTHATTEVNT